LKNKLSENINTKKLKAGEKQGKMPKPPEHSKFKKGISGNPKGLKKGTVQMRTRLKRLLEITSNLKNPLNG